MKYGTIVSKTDACIGVMLFLFLIYIYIYISDCFILYC